MGTWTGGDSNPGPLPCEGSALPAELPAPEGSQSTRRSCARSGGAPRGKALHPPAANRRRWPVDPSGVRGVAGARAGQVSVESSTT